MGPGLSVDSVRKMRRLLTLFGLLLVVMTAMPSSLAGQNAEDAPKEAAAELSAQTVRKGLGKDANPGDIVLLIERIQAAKASQFYPELTPLMRHPNQAVREAAAQAITSFGWDVISTEMLRILKDTRGPHQLRELVCRALTKTGRREVVEPLLELTTEKTMRTAAITGLRNLTGQNYFTPEDWQKWWLVNRGRKKEQWDGIHQEALLRRIRELELAVAAREDELRKNSGRIDERNRERDALKKEAESLRKRTADAMIRSLENRAEKKNPTVLLAALDGPFVKVREYAALELGRIAAVEAVDKLSRLASTDSALTVRVASTRALGQIGSARDVPVSRKLLGNRDEPVAAAAARALGVLKAKAAVNQLLVTLLHHSAMVRGSAAEALGRIGSVAALVPLVELLNGDPDASVREQAARALGLIGDKRAYTALADALNDTSPAVRVCAIESLGPLKIPGTSEKLCGVLRTDPSPNVCEAAIVMLGLMGDAKSLETLIAVLDRPEKKLRQLVGPSILAICKRDGSLLEPTSDTLIAAGHQESAVMLLEVLERSLAEKKDDKGRFRVRRKLIDCLGSLKQWKRVTPILAEFTKANPDDTVMAIKYARALGGLHNQPEAIRVYKDLAAKDKTNQYWDERLALMEAMLADKKAPELQNLIGEYLKNRDQLSAEIIAKLTNLLKRCDEAIAKEQKLRVEENLRLIRELASADKKVRDTALEQLKSRGAEVYPYLINALDWSDERMRRASVELLREMTKQNFNYSPSSSLKENSEAIKKWKDWLKSASPA